MDMHDVPCGLDFASFVVAGKWKLIIVYHLRSGPRRFRDIKRRVAGISARVLAQQLRELAAADVLVRYDHQQSTPRVDYTLTPFGMTLVEAILPLCAWGMEHRDRIEGMMLSRMSEQSSQQCASPDGCHHRGTERIVPQQNATPDLKGRSDIGPARRGNITR